MIRETVAKSGRILFVGTKRQAATPLAEAAERCAHCDISLVFHASLQKLCCHYCDYATPPPDDSAEVDPVATYLST